MDNILERFKTYKVDIEGKSVSSINQYIYRMKGFIEYYNIDNEDKFLGLTAEDIKSWISYLVTLGNDIPTRNAKLVAVKEIYKYLFEEEDKNIDIKILKIKSAKVPKRESKYLTKIESQHYLYNITNLRTYAMVVVFLSTGMRLCELMQITLDDVKNGMVSVIGKGNKERTLYFSPDCLDIINKYINKKRNHIIERTGVNINLLFISDEGTPITRQSFSASLKHYAQKSGISWWEQMSPHKLRHSFATQILNERTVDGGLKHTIKDVSELLGHANIVTTDRYTHSTEETRKNITSAWNIN